MACVNDLHVLATTGASHLLLTFVPVSAILLGTLLLGEVLLPRHLAGMARIGLGLAAIDGRLRGSGRRRGGSNRPRQPRP
jgi:drug/metabolite transporter (DMT)-like permease